MDEVLGRAVKSGNPALEDAVLVDFDGGEGDSHAQIEFRKRDKAARGEGSVLVREL